MGNKNPELDQLFSRAKKWKEEMNLLREIILEFDLKEEKKWYQPCYTYNGKNLLLIGGFKEYMVLSFFKGVLLKDSKKLLTKHGDNTQSARTLRFTNPQEIIQIKDTIREYVQETIENEKKGLKVVFQKPDEIVIPHELQQIFELDKPYLEAFNSLTPGRKRSWLLHFSGAKQQKTIESRIQKARSQILLGKGHNEDYQKKKPS